MTIDERIEALTLSLELFERHTRERSAVFERELESMKGRQASIEERQARIDDNMIVQGELMVRLERRVDQLAERMDDLGRHVNAIANATAELQVLTKIAHERLDKLESS